MLKYKERLQLSGHSHKDHLATLFSNQYRVTPVGIHREWAISTSTQVQVLFTDSTPNMNEIASNIGTVETTKHVRACFFFFL